MIVIKVWCDREHVRDPHELEERIRNEARGALDLSKDKADNIVVVFDNRPASSDPDRSIELEVSIRRGYVDDHRALAVAASTAIARHTNVRVKWLDTTDPDRVLCSSAQATPTRYLHQVCSLLDAHMVTAQRSVHENCTCHENMCSGAGTGICQPCDAVMHLRYLVAKAAHIRAQADRSDLEQCVQQLTAEILETQGLQGLHAELRELPR